MTIDNESSFRIVIRMNDECTDFILTANDKSNDETKTASFKINSLDYLSIPYLM